jgi:hypothetical protein
MLKRKEAGNIFMKSNGGMKNSIGSYDSGRSNGIHSNPDLQYAYNQAMNGHGYNTNRNNYDTGYDEYNAKNDRLGGPSSYPNILNDYSYGGYQPPAYNSHNLSKGYLHPNYNVNNNNPLYGGGGGFGGGSDLPSNRFVSDVESYNNFTSNSYDNFSRGGGRGGGYNNNYNPRNFNDLNENFAGFNLDNGGDGGGENTRRSNPKKINNQISGLNAKDARTRVY